MNFVGGAKYLMYGGIEAAPTGGKVAPNADVFTLRMLRDKWVWEKQSPSGEETPPARSQHVAQVLPPGNDRMFVFGGHHTPTVRLNDTWMLNTKEYVWTRAKGDKATEENKESAIGAPPPRANAGSCVYKNKIYVYGGHGGLNYQRVCLDDIYTYDLETEQWEQIEVNIGLQLPPPGRGGHTIFISEEKLYAYGGWNHESVYNKIEMFDLQTREWSDPDIYNVFPGPRWNHAAVMVEAIPAWKYFIFGGESANFHEGQARTFGACLDTACYLDMETLVWNEIKPEGSTAPPPREYASLCYDADESKLITFGGWNNGWLNDLWTLNVNKVVGPPYAIASITPALGQLSGNTPCVITGVGFRDNGCQVFFTPGTVGVDAPVKSSISVPGTCLSENEIQCMTPNFALHGARECVVQLIMSSKDLTTTHCEFKFFQNTRAAKSLCYGTGLLPDMAVGEPVEFWIQARNDDGENRLSGRDEYHVRVMTDEETPTEVPCQIVDNDDGTYTVSYTVEQPCNVNIKVQFKDEAGEVVPVRGSPYKASFSADTNGKANVTIGPSLAKAAQGMIESLQGFMKETSAGVKLTDKDLTDVKVLLDVQDHETAVRLRSDEITLVLDQLQESLRVLIPNNLAKEVHQKQTNKLFDEWNTLKKTARETKKEIALPVRTAASANETKIEKLDTELKNFQQQMKKREFFKYDCGREQALLKLDGVFEEIRAYEYDIEDLGYNARKFGNPESIEQPIKQTDAIKNEVNNMKALWDHIAECQETFEKYMATAWPNVEPFEMEDNVKKLMSVLKNMKVDKRCDAYNGSMNEIKKMLVFLPLIGELRNEAMRDRHWDIIRKMVGQDFKVDESLMLRDIYDMNLGGFAEEVEECTDQARQEAKMEKTLAKLKATWSVVKFDFAAFKDTEYHTARLGEEDFEALEEDQTKVTAMLGSRYLATFEDEINMWNTNLELINGIVVSLREVQQSWGYLENLFIHSEEVKKELPKAAEEFVKIDASVKFLLKDAYEKQFALDFSSQDGHLAKIEGCQAELIKCEKALNKFMADKRSTFPRFHFVSDSDLLDMLSNGSQPDKVMHHLPKIFQAIGDLKLESGQVRPAALGMISCVGTEYVEFTSVLKLLGKVECYMQEVIDFMRKSLRDISCDSFKKAIAQPRTDWLKLDAAQCTLLVSLSNWVTSVEKGFAAANLAPTLEACLDDLTDLIKMVMDTSMSKQLRTKVMCLITMDAHSRDIIGILKAENVTKVDHFKWQSQMKAYYEDDVKDFNLRIADAAFYYGYEYLGNGPRLVVTPLTDRIYVTATQALHLKMGCAPAGPAGTGKTETTKDLSSSMGKAIYVFNCSDQMDYIGLAGIFKGLAASGSWGCFDEFNRLIPEVLSVCSVQFKAVTDAIRQGAKRFVIQDDEVDLDPSCGAYITMNPGYIGRSELPEGLKALFRPITVVVPDLNLICQNMLMAEGFIGAQALADKFTTLYFLCKDLLSAQMHYDWGLRAIKSVLVVAGVFKRAEPDILEDAILMRALRDFNLPKIAAEDLEVFMGLLTDLFPGIDPPRKRDMEFEEIILKAALELKMFKDEEFILKIVQLKELMEIRHSVFTMGPPGCGKSMTWKTLARAWSLSGTKCAFVDINPKVVSTNEFYGVVHPATREWIDGLFSCKLRDFAKEMDTNWKWIILDGDLDANWIESMNSVMDDNKLLTLASNERIALKPHMKLIFEIRNLNFATPATVSRAGILYISDDDGYQWRAYVKAWIQNSAYDNERKEKLQQQFNMYIPETYEYCARNFKNIVPQVLISQVMNICKLLEIIFKQHDVKGLEFVFVFCVIWCMGAGLEIVEGNKSRLQFDKFWREHFKIIKFPTPKTVFDYYVDMENPKFNDWNQLRSDDVENSIDTAMPITNYTVPTPDTIASQYIMKKFLQIGVPPMLVGMAGCGKTQIIKGLLNDLVEKGDEFKSQIVNFNFFTDANMLQKILESQLQKAGAGWGPEGQSKLIYFVDDLNMPKQDPYETQTAIALVRQHLDYSHWYDKQKLVMRKIMRTQYISSMNATAGSFTINPRLQRWFWLLAVNFPESSSLQTIYSAFMLKHYVKFKGTISEQVAPIIKQTLQLHNEVATKFRKTAANFHYEFNVRHLTNVFQGLLTAKVETIKEPDNLIRLWVHECERIYGDRLVSPTDLANYRQIVADLCKKSFTRFNLTKYFAQPTPEPLVFAYFVDSLDDKVYDQFATADKMADQLTLALREYNELNAVMDLVLFEDAMKHVCKVTRILTAAGGHALLVGVGGMGKQSLSRLSAFICQYTNVGIVISSTYSINDFKADLQAMFLKTGVKDEGLMFLFTEGQIKTEGFLVFLNDLLSSGEIADLFVAEDIDGILTNLGPAAKSDGLQVTPANVWNYFIGRVKRNLHMALCMSPSDSFRSRARKFPAIINCTVIDWFHPWPQDALLSVAAKQLEEVEMASDEERKAIIDFMPFSFGTVNDYSALVYAKEKRHIYTTPKSFLELIALFKSMLASKRALLVENREKYDKGVLKLQETGEQVAELEENLKVTSVVVEEKKKHAAEQAEIVGGEKAKVEISSNTANVESAKCAVIATQVAAQMEAVTKDLAAAIPALEAAEGALNGLNVKQFQTLKALTTAPKPIQITFACVMHLFCTVDPLVPVDKKGRLNAPGGDPWKCVAVQLKNPQVFLDKLKNFKTEIEARNVPPINFESIKHILADENFVVEKVKTAAECCGNLCDWVKNIDIFYHIFMNVEPKKKAAEQAGLDLEAANTKKAEMENMVAELTAALKVLQDKFQEVMDDKEAAEAEAERCASKLDLAQRLVNALGSESTRWAQAIIDLDLAIGLIIGDVLLASAFVSYVGPFAKKYRTEIMDVKFMKFFVDNKIPMSANSNPLNILTTPASVAMWGNQKLPSDAVSVENGAILTSSARYSLIIDPQLQGITWLREREKENNLQVTRLTNPKVVKVVEAAVEQGLPVLIENLYDSIDAVLQPVYARAVIKKGRNRYIKMGDKELALHPNFNLYLHTKLSNPHYQPEIQAECTLINFTVTESGLEDQLLDLVVLKERPDLAEQKAEIIQQMNQFKITLGELEEDLLFSLANSTGDILDDVPLVEKLEKAKMLSVEIAAKVEIAKETQVAIYEASEAYRPAANRGALVFFLLNELYMIHDFYKFSLDSFVIVVKRAIDIVAAEMAPKKPEPVEGEEGEEPEEPEEEEEEEKDMTPRTLQARVAAITESITYQGYNYTRRGTFEKHKLLIATMLCLRIQVRKGVLAQDEVDALIAKDPALDVPNQPDSLKIINEVLWPGIVGLQKIKIFEDLTRQMENEALQWKKWYGDAQAESCDLPRAYAGLPLFQRLLLLRTMRPDRLTGALTEYVREALGEAYIEQPVFSFDATYEETSPETPMFFVLFPGENPTPLVEDYGAKIGKTSKDGTFTNISMGQGQEKIAEDCLADSAKNGKWIMIQNVHLMITWMKSFERRLEVALADDCHADFRCFISSEPLMLPGVEVIPEAILQNSIKVANEAPQNLKANLRRAFSKFPEENYERAKTHKEKEYKALLFGLCMFHSLILGRKKFGSQGWSRNYSFNDGDLTICGDVLHNYLEKYEQIPYDDLKYIFGEIMYGGHITDNLDRRTNATYLEKLIKPEILLQMNLTMYHPGFKSPDPMKFDRAKYENYIETALPVEVPEMFGLHKNAEIGYLTQTAESLFFMIQQISGGSGGGGDEGGSSKINELIHLFLEKCPPLFPMLDLLAAAAEKGRTPPVVVCLQESDRMNKLLMTIKTSLQDLDAGRKGTLNITEAMEALSISLNLNQVPQRWFKVAYHSNKTLLVWLDDLIRRCDQFSAWGDEFITPNVLWISGLFNPMSYLTAIMQLTARKGGLPLDDMCLRTEVQNLYEPEDFPDTAENGGYIYGLSLEGAGWELGRNGEQGYLCEMVLKELSPTLPVMHVTAIRKGERKTAGFYDCPVYFVTQRGQGINNIPNFVTSFSIAMESEDTDDKYWILSGVALFFAPEQPL